MLKRLLIKRNIHSLLIRMACQNLSTSEELLSKYETFLFDCDGVLWNTEGVIPGAVEAINKLKSLNKRVMFVTNNSTKSRQGYLKKFIDYGFNVTQEEVYGTAYLPAVYIKNVLKTDKKVYVVGMSGITEELELLGIPYIEHGHIKVDDSQPPFQAIHVNKDTDVGALVVGYDPYFNINKLTEAAQYAVDANIPFIATNTDRSFPGGNGVTIPGTGCIVAAVEAVANRKAVVLGKPNKMMFELMCSLHDINPNTTLMTGDRLDTDVLFGKNCGLSTLCVLSGVTDQQLIEKVSSSGNIEHLPDYVAPGISILNK